MSTAAPVAMTDIKVGDRIARKLVDDPPDRVIWLTVTEVTEFSIFCNRWEFDRKSGEEVDHDLKWGPDYPSTGAYIVRVQRS